MGLKIWIVTCRDIDGNSNRTLDGSGDVNKNRKLAIFKGR